MKKKNAQFASAKWIGKKYKLIHHKRKREETILHFLNSPMRRTIDRLFSLFGYQNRDWLNAPYFRREVHVKNVKEATVNVTGLGYFELYINGQKVGNDILTPAYSQYEKTVYFHTYDISNHLIDGANIFSIVLGNGMYNVHLNNAWNYDTAHWRSVPKFILKAEIVGDQHITVVSDETWKVATGPIMSDDIYGGETYDARLEIKKFHEVSFDDSSLENAIKYKSPTKELKLTNIEPIRVINEIKPLDYWQISKNKYIFDIGTNISGFARLKVRTKKGTRIVITYGEMLKGKELDNKGIFTHTKKAHHKYLQKDIYICKGDGIEIWQPSFTYHAFQYVQVEGLEEVFEDTITGILTHTDVDVIGDFNCSNELQNNIFTAMNRTNLNNYQGIPTDCPHREKNGWTGDVNLSVEYQLLTFSAEHILKKWMFDLVDGQRHTGQICCIAPTPGWGYNWISGPVWDSSFVIIPWNIYLYRGDKKILERLYPHIKNYLAWQDKKTKNNLITYGLGDWCSPNRPANKPKAPVTLTSTAYHFETFKLMSKIAGVLGKHDDQKFFNIRKEGLKKAINKKFINHETGYVKGDCQTSYSAVLYFDLVEKDLKQKVLDRLIDQVKIHNYHVDTGIIGTRFLFDALSNNGYADIVYKIASQTDYPSWGAWIKQGATTLWEQWDGKESRNHRMFGSICSWYYSYLAGIKPDENNPGLQHIKIQPCFVRKLDYVEAKTSVNDAEVLLKWERKDNQIFLTVSLPDRVKATVYVDNNEKNIIHNHNCEIVILENQCSTNK